MEQTIKDIMARNCSHWKLDKKLAKQLSDFVKYFINRNEDHVNFFGGNLTGVHIIKFTTAERFRMTEEILEIDDLQIQEEVRQLDHIGETWVRGTDGLNLALLYLVHLLANDNKLSSKERYDMQVNALLILQYKFLSSIISSWFKFPVSEEIALATYQSLNGKYSIKKHGNWQALLLNRCRNILIEEKTHLDTIASFQPDDKVQYMITDIQGRLKQLILNIYEITVRIKDAGDAIGTQSSHIELDGEMTLRDITRKQVDYLNYLRKVAPEPREFIKEDLVDVIDVSITTMPKKLLVDALLEFSTDIKTRNSNANVLAEEVIFFCFNYFAENRNVITDTRDYSRVIKTMKDLYNAGKSNTPAILKARKVSEKICKKVVKTNNPATLAGVRTGLILYILLRTLTKEHYG